MELQSCCLKEAFVRASSAKRSRRTSSNSSRSAIPQKAQLKATEKKEERCRVASMTG